MRVGTVMAVFILVLLSVTSCDFAGDKAMEYIDEKAEEAVQPTPQSEHRPVTPNRNPPLSTPSDTPVSNVGPPVESGADSPNQYTGTVDGGDSQMSNGSDSISFKSVSTGAYHTCGIRADSSVTCWGA